MGVADNKLNKDFLLFSLSENNEVILFSLFSFDENKILLLSSIFENKEFLLLLLLTSLFSFGHSTEENILELILVSTFISFFELFILLSNKDVVNNLDFVLLFIVESFDIFSSFLFSIILLSDFMIFSLF